MKDASDNDSEEASISAETTNATEIAAQRLEFMIFVVIV
jgi:hypothetical protein